MVKVYIWGTGYEAEKCISYINYEECQVVGYVETNPQKNFGEIKKFIQQRVFVSFSMIM